MNLDAFFSEFPVWEACPRSSTHPWVSDSGDVVVRPPSYAQGANAALNLPGRVIQTGSLAKHRAPALEWWAAVQVVMVLLRRLGLGPLYQSSASLPLTDGVNWVHSDIEFDVVSVDGVRIRVAAPDGAFDARSFTVYNYQHTNSLYVPGGEAVHYINRPIAGSVQPFDEVHPHLNSVLNGKAVPMVVGIEPVSGTWEDFEPGDSFVIVTDQDCTNIAEQADPTGDTAETIRVRMHVADPANWMTLTEPRPFYASRRFRTIAFAEADTAGANPILLKDDALADTRIARPFVGNSEFSPTFRVQRIDTDGTLEDITAAFLAAGRVAVVHSGASGYQTKLWLGDSVQGTAGAGALLTAGQRLSILYMIPGDAARDPAVCHGRCHHARQSGDGRTFCALADNGYVDEAAEEWVSTPPSGLDDFRAECYQWSSGSGPAGCSGYTDRTPTTVADWISFWNQLWAERGLQLIQQGVGSTDYRIRRAGVEGLIHVGGGRLDIGMELGEAAEYMARQTSAGYLNEALEWVTGLLMTHRDNGADLDDPDTWGEPGLLEYRGIAPNATNDLGASWGSADDPNYAARRVPRMPAVQAEGTSSGGRSAGDRARLVTWRDIAVSVLDSRDGEPQECGGFVVTSEEDGTMKINLADSNPLAVFTAAIVAGTIAVASMDSGLLKLEMANGFRNTYFTNTAPDPDEVETGTIRTGGQIVRPHQRHEILADSLFGDGGNIGRGVMPGDVAAFIPPDAGGAVHGFEVVKAQPCAGGTEAYGWNGDTGDTPPASIADYLPTAHNTWGIKRDVVWCRPRNIADFTEDVAADLPGTSVAFGQDGVWAGASAPTVQIAAAGSGDWSTVTPESINYCSGEIVLAEADVAAIGGPLDIKVEGEVQDRRRYVAKADVKLVQDTLAAVDEFDVPLGSNAAAIRVTLEQREYEYSNQHGWYDGATWVPGDYSVGTAATSPGYVFGASQTPNGANLNLGDNYTWEVVLNAAPIPLTPGGALATVADGATIESAKLVLTLSNIEETTYTETRAGGSSTASQSSSVSTTAADVRILAIAYPPGEDTKFQVLWASDAVSAGEGERTEIDLTEFAQLWLSELRAGTFTNIGLVLVPDNGILTEDGSTLLGFVPRKSYSHYEPLYSDTLPTVNPDFDDNAYSLTWKVLTMDLPAFHHFAVKFATLPSPGPTALPANPATNGFRRIKHPWVAEP